MVPGNGILSVSQSLSVKIRIHFDILINSRNGTQLVYSNLLVNMTKKIALATQFVINRKTSATDYQVRNIFHFQRLSLK